MLVELALPFVDVRASDLSLVLGAPRAPALEVLTQRLGDVEVELRLLGCSHQAIVGELSETVACVPGVPGRLPASRDEGDYRFEAHVERLSTHRARCLLDGVRDDPAALAALFPGLRDAFTALRVAAVPGAVSWATWHAYPQTGELVCTRSVVRTA